MKDITEKPILLSEEERNHIVTRRGLGDLKNTQERETINDMIDDITEEKEIEKIVAPTKEEASEEVLTFEEDFANMKESISFLERRIRDITYLVNSYKGDVLDKVQVSKEILKLAREVHQLRLHVDKLAPKVGIAFWGFAAAVGLLASFVFPELRPVLDGIIKFITKG